MNLPCHHIFKVREMFTVPLYSPHLSAERWTRQFYSKVCRAMPANQTLNNVGEDPEDQTLNNLGEVCTNKNHVVSISTVKRKKRKYQMRMRNLDWLL